MIVCYQGYLNISLKLLCADSETRFIVMFPVGKPVGLDLRITDVCSLLDVLESVHNLQIVHRDIRPDNLLLVSLSKVKLFLVHLITVV